MMTCKHLSGVIAVSVFCAWALPAERLAVGKKKEPQGQEAVPAKAAAASTFTDERDNEVYKLLVVNGKTWMAEPLRFKPEGTRGYVYWENKEANKAAGIFYTANLAKTILPKGWHLPNEGECTELLKTIGVSQAEVKKAGIDVGLFRFDELAFQTLKQYAGNEFMLQTLNPRPFKVETQTIFLSVTVVPMKLPDGTAYNTTQDGELVIDQTASRYLPGPPNQYLRLLLVKD